jgi:DNA-binding response OmpR family regulator
MTEVKKKILVVEDEELILRALAEGLGKRGFETIKAEDGKRGWEMAESEKPDLVLLDLMLPVMSGQEVLAKLKESGLLARVPVLVLTNVSDGATLKQCFDLGAKDYIIKANFSFEALVKKIKEYI